MNFIVSGRLLPRKTIFQSCLLYLKDILLPYDYIKFELDIFRSLGEIRINSIFPRISDQQLPDVRYYRRLRKLMVDQEGSDFYVVSTIMLCEANFPVGKV